MARLKIMGWFCPWCNAFDTSGIIQGWNGSNMSKQRTISSSLTCQFPYICLWRNQSQSSFPCAWVAEAGGGNSDCFAPAGAALFQDSISPGPRCVCPAELLCPWSFTSACIPCAPVAWSLPQGVAGVANNRAGLACPAIYLPLSNTEPFCGLSRICWSWGNSPSCFDWCLGCFSLPPAPVLLCSVWVLNTPDECSHLKAAGM